MSHFEAKKRLKLLLFDGHFSWKMFFIEKTLDTGQWTGVILLSSGIIE